MQVSMNSNVTAYGRVGAAEKSKEVGKPTWNGNKVYKYLEDFNAAAINYGKQAALYYASVTEKDGAMTVDELKKQIGEMFSGYTLTDRESTDVVAGKHYLYIDKSQLKKMAEDASYRAKVYGLMDREYNVSAKFTLQYSDGKNVTEHCTGSFFNLSESNRKYAGADGIPYLGGCMTDHPWSSSDSHCQVRNQSFLYDHIDPAKSAAKERKAAAVKQEAEKRNAKLAEKRKAKVKEREKQLQDVREKRRAEKTEAEEKAQELAEEKREEARRTEQEMLEEELRIQYSTTGEHFDYSV